MPCPVLVNEPGHITDFVASRDYALPHATQGLTSKLQVLVAVLEQLVFQNLIFAPS